MKTKAKTTPEQALLNQILIYDPETGGRIWRTRPRGMFTSDRYYNSWNARFAGKAALTSFHQGYFYGSIFGQNYMAHRIIWKMIHGTDPAEIDHENGIRSDNRLLNLAASDCDMNAKNRSLYSNNTSGFGGVCWHDGRWVAYFYASGKRFHLGYFSTFDEARAARMVANQNHGFSRRHGQRAGEIR